MFRTLDDYKKDKGEDKNKKTTDSYTGGSSSGMAVSNPADDFITNVKNKNDKESFDKTKNKITLKVYRNGFIIDNGPFRDLSVPENKTFMTQVEKGVIPQELVDQGMLELGIQLEDHKSTDYKEPEPEKKFEAFVGSGTTFGGVQSEGLGVFKDVQFNVDKKSPVCTVNIRLHTGEVIVQEFNLTHTIGDIFSFVSQVAPVVGEFNLIEGFPPKPLTEMNKTIQELRLQGTMLTQRLC